MSNITNGAPVKDLLKSAIISKICGKQIGAQKKGNPYGLPFSLIG